MNKNLCLNNSEKEWLLKVRSTLNFHNTNTEDEKVVIPNDEVWYTSTDGEVINFNLNNDVVSNTYENGFGIIKCSTDISSISINSNDKNRLVSIVFPGTMRSIYNNVFSQCNNLEEVNFTDRSGKLTTGYSSFQNCPKLKTVNIGDGDVELGNGAFYGCTELRSVNFGNGNITLKGSVFFNCSKLISVSIRGEGSFVLGDLDFFYMAPLSDLYFGNRDVTINGTTGGYYITNFVTNGNLILSNYSYNAFSNNRFKRLDIGDGIYINSASRVFSSCSIPYLNADFYISGSSTAEIFYSCELGDIIFGENSSMSGMSGSGFSGNFSKCTIQNFIFKGKNFEGKYDFIKESTTNNIIFDENTETIKLNASVISNSTVGTIDFGNANVTLENCPFFENNNIDRIKFGTGNITFKNVTFSYSNINSIIVNSDNPTYDSRNNCNAIIETATNTLRRGCNSSTIPEGITSIGFGAFMDINLTDVILPSTLTNIGNAAFNISDQRRVRPMTSITSLNTTPPTLGDGVFDGQPEDLPIYVPSESVNTYKAASGWSDRADYIQAIQ